MLKKNGETIGGSDRHTDMAIAESSVQQVDRGEAEHQAMGGMIEHLAQRERCKNFLFFHSYYKFRPWRGAGRGTWKYNRPARCRHR